MRLPVKTFRAFSTAAPKLVSERRLYWRRAMSHNRANAPSTTQVAPCATVAPVSGAALGAFAVTFYPCSSAQSVSPFGRHPWFFVIKAVMKPVIEAGGVAQIDTWIMI
jgi:hypothetical protein